MKKTKKSYLELELLVGKWSIQPRSLEINLALDSPLIAEIHILRRHLLSSSKHIPHDILTLKLRKQLTASLLLKHNLSSIIMLLANQPRRLRSLLINRNLRSLSLARSLRKRSLSISLDSLDGNLSMRDSRADGFERVELGEEVLCVFLDDGAAHFGVDDGLGRLLDVQRFGEESSHSR